jgi:bifunctional non-homologous end joining protein LigD
MAEALPSISPVTVARRAKPFDDPAWSYEVKVDGFRGLLRVERGRPPRFISRGGAELTQFAGLASQLTREIDAESAIFDGEIAALDEHGCLVFLNLLRRREPYIYYGFDLLFCNGMDLRELPLVERRRRLDQVLPRKSALMAGVLAVDGEGSKLFTIVYEHDVEGIVAKKMTDPYARRTRWWKVKNPNYSQASDRRAELLTARRRTTAGER